VQQGDAPVVAVAAKDGALKKVNSAMALLIVCDV
jgi:hypothetical protein